MHLPALRGKLKPAELSELRGTLGARGRVGRAGAQAGPPARLAPERPAARRHARALLGEHIEAQRDLWIYGYGSLMWDPGFHFAEVRLAHLPGYQRRFTYWTRIARGTRERPALMLTLEQVATANAAAPGWRSASRATWPRPSRPCCGGARCCAAATVPRCCR